MRRKLTLLSLLTLGVASAACHSHDGSGTIGAGAGPGSNGAFVFTTRFDPLRVGQLTDVIAVDGGAPADIANWEIFAGPGGVLVPNADSSSVRFIATEPGFHVIQAEGVGGEIGTFGFDVFSSAADLEVTEVIDGTDDDAVDARMTTSGNDHYIAQRVGNAAAPQVLARVTRGGLRELEITLPFKVDDIAADGSNRVTLVRPAATLTDALVRVDRDLQESGTFAAPDLGGASWSSVIAMTPTGRTILATDVDGGSLIQIQLDGDFEGGSIDAAKLPLPVPFADVIDLTAGLDDEIFVATATEIVRVLADGTVDSERWTPEQQVAIRAIDADGRGVLHVVLQDADGGQCGSIRQLDWLGGQVRRYSDFTDPSASEFAARKVLSPEDVCAFVEGAWRLFDDTVTLDPAFPSAAWIVAGELQQP